MNFPGARIAGISLAFLSVTVSLAAADLSACSTGARTYLPCELSFPFTPTASLGAFDEVLRVEFRSPSHRTYLLRSFWDSSAPNGMLRVRFSPIEAGTWTYHVLSDVGSYHDEEKTFSVSESGLPGFVNVANVRHWRSTDKKPHLWLSASVPDFSQPQTQFDALLDNLKAIGCTHLRGPLLAESGSSKPFLGATQTPNAAYFADLDSKLLAAINKGFTLDLLLASERSFQKLWPPNPTLQEQWIRYLVARYGGLNVTWAGVENFESLSAGRQTLRSVSELLQKYDGFAHPRTTGAIHSTFPLINDGWLDFGTESSPNAELGAVEHHFTEMPEVHQILASEPAAFRHELWSATTNGQSIGVQAQALENPANRKALEIWSRIMNGTRYWEFEPYFDVDGGRCVGLNEVEYLAYAVKPGIVELTLPKHKYNPLWINPATGEESYLKDYRGEVFSRSTPDNERDWILQVPRDGKKASMLKYYYFESQDPPLQEIETDGSRIPFQVDDPKGTQLHVSLPAPFRVKLTKSNRATRQMQFVWWGETVGENAGMRLLGIGSEGAFDIPPAFKSAVGSSVNLRILAINANGKAYELDQVFELVP